MNFYVPVVTGATKAGKQSEGATVTEATPTAELETAKLETVAGMLVISQQLHDRGFTGGGAFDEVVGRLRRRGISHVYSQTWHYLLQLLSLNGDAKPVPQEPPPNGAESAPLAADATPWENAGRGVRAF
jgi:hypothetical protein